LVANFNK